MAAINEQDEPVHPDDPSIHGCHHVQLTAPGSTARHSRHAMAIHPGWFDRSPCGTGTSARMAQLHARGELPLHTEFANESFIGTRFTGRLLGDDRGRRAPGRPAQLHRPRLDHRNRPVPAGPRGPLPGGVRAVSASGPALPVLGGRKPSHRERVVEALRAALIAGELRPGEVYSAPGLAARFGVSATPVREAMLDLVREGLVDTVPNKGFRVTAVSERQLDEYTHIRSLIEIPTTTGLATTADTVALQALRPVAEEIVTSALAGDLIAYVDADLRFHLGLLELAGNAHLVDVVRDLRRRSRLYGLTALVEQGRLQASAEEHLEILDALLARDEEAVRAVMTRHLGHVRGLWAAPGQ